MSYDLLNLISLEALVDDGGVCESRMNDGGESLKRSGETFLSGSFIVAVVETPSSALFRCVIHSPSSAAVGALTRSPFGIELVDKCIDIPFVPPKSGSASHWRRRPRG